MRLYLSILGFNPIDFKFEIDEKYCSKAY